MTLRVVDFKEGKFECGGKTFFVVDSLSFNRHRELGRIGIEFGFGKTFVDIYKGITKVREHLNKIEFVDCAVELNNLEVGLAKLDDKYDPALRLCALFINEEDEDTTVFDEVKMKAKIDCWSKELDVSPFFHLAASLVDGWMPVYRLITRNISKEANEKDQ